MAKEENKSNFTLAKDTQIFDLMVELLGVYFEYFKEIWPDSILLDFFAVCTNPCLFNSVF